MLRVRTRGRYAFQLRRDGSQTLHERAQHSSMTPEGDSPLLVDGVGKILCVSMFECESVREENLRWWFLFENLSSVSQTSSFHGMTSTAWYH